MGKVNQPKKGKDIYVFWHDVINDELNQISANIIVNLAYNEYFESINPIKILHY